MWFMMIVAFIFVFKFIADTASGDLPSFQDLENPTYDEASIVYDSHGTPFGKYYVENRELIDYNDISPKVIQALIATEDIRFHSHSGIDLKALFRVAFKTILLQKESSGGGSTVTQQLAKLLYKRQSTAGISSDINDVSFSLQPGEKARFQ